MAPTARDRPFLDPAVVARLATLELKARAIVEGTITGMHRSPFKGFSVEFAEYRQYMPGDDLAAIDWKIYARSDRHYVKKFEEETNLQCHVMLDVSASMGYGGAHGITKFEYGQYLAAALAYMMNRQRDAAGLTTFDERILQTIPASARPGHLHAILVTLGQTVVGKQTNVAKPMHQLADALKRRGLVVLISDLMDEPERVIRGLKHLRFRGTEVIVFHVMDPDEMNFPFERATRFEDLETGQEVLAVPALVRDHYMRAVGEMNARYKQQLGAAGIDYHLLMTDQPLEMALLAYLSTRGRSL